MNKRIKKKVAIRKCQKSLEKMKQIFHGADEEFLQGMENMYARRIATTRNGEMTELNYNGKNLIK